MYDYHEEETMNLFSKAERLLDKIERGEGDSKEIAYEVSDILDDIRARI